MKTGTFYITFTFYIILFISFIKIIKHLDSISKIMKCKLKNGFVVEYSLQI